MEHVEILLTIESGIALVTFNRPQARNAITFGMYQALANICMHQVRDRRIKAIVVTGAGDHAFAAGTDISQFREFKSAKDAQAYETTIDEVLTAIETCRVPTIAAIHGACTGGGAAIATVCDLRIASEDLKFGFPMARTLGNCLSLKSLSRISTLIGEARARELLFTARLVGAEEAYSTGLISKIVVDRDAVVEAAIDLARTVASHAPLTVRATKEAFHRLRTQQSPKDEDLIELCYTSNDFKEGIEAFLAKRKPVWTGT